MSFGPGDSGLLDFKTAEEAKDYLEELGLKFKYGCHREGNAVQCHSLGRWLETVRHEYSEAADIFRKNCFTRRFSESCTKYAFYKIFGADNVKRDCQQAFDAHKFGCLVIEHGKCCQAAGELLLDGIATDTDTKIKSHIDNVTDYFRRGCENNCLVSCYYLGGLFHKRASHQRDTDVTAGSGSISQPRSDAELALRKSAVLAWVKACEGGHELACRNAARAYRLGDGVEKDETVANNFMRKLSNHPRNGDEK